MVIIDDESVLDLCKQIMQINGWNVMTALGGIQGLETATQFADQISCMLVDVVMPEMGANELLRELENRKIDNPIVLMSGFSQTKLECFAKHPNVVSIAQQPFRVAELQYAVQEAALRVLPVPGSACEKAA